MGRAMPGIVVWELGFGHRSLFWGCGFGLFIGLRQLIGIIMVSNGTSNVHQGRYGH